MPKPKKLTQAQILLETYLRELKLDFVREFQFDETRRWRADYAIQATALAGGDRILLEIEGGIHNFKNRKTGQLIVGHHHHEKGYESDCLKYSTGSAMGYRYFRFTTGQVMRGEAKEFLKKWLVDKNRA